MTVQKRCNFGATLVHLHFSAPLISFVFNGLSSANAFRCRKVALTISLWKQRVNCVAAKCRQVGVVNYPSTTLTACVEGSYFLPLIWGAEGSGERGKGGPRFGEAVTRLTEGR